MAGLDYLFSSQAPGSVTSNVATTNGLPDWYQEYIRGIAAKGTQIAGAQANVDIPAMSVAGFNPDQTQAFQQVRDNQGAWQPNINAATAAANTIQPGTSALVQQGQDAVAGPAQTWNDQTAAQYMSPYTTGVLNEIQRLGTRNLNENLLPAVQDKFIGGGQFGSSRNADVIGRTVRDANADITGQMAGALQSGYTNAQTMFSNDAQRAQQQQQMQSGAALTGAGLNTAAGQSAASTLGALGQTTAALGLNDAQQLGAVGTQQQQLQQEGLNAGYTNANNALNFDWNTLNNLNSITRGMQLPQTAVQSSNAPLPGASFGASPLAQVGGALSSLTGK